MAWHGVHGSGCSAHERGQGNTFSVEVSETLMMEIHSFIYLVSLHIGQGFHSLKPDVRVFVSVKYKKGLLDDE